MGLTTERKREYGKKLQGLIAEYGRCLVITCDNIGSNHIQQVRMKLRGRAELLFGKNTMVRRILRNYAEDHPEVEGLIEAVNGNIGFVFTKEDMVTIRDELNENRVGSAAKAGAVAPCDVHIDAGPTGLEPSQTSFLHALNIPSKINRGQIEILNPVHLIKKGEKVGSSEAALLQKLGVTPFEYGLDVITVWDEGCAYDASFLDLGEDDVITKFAAGVTSIACLSLAIGYPTIASLPHVIVNGFKNVLNLSLATEYTIDAAKELKEALDNPEAFLAALPAASAAPAAEAATEAAAPAAAEEESEEEEEEDMFDLFG